MVEDREDGLAELLKEVRRIEVQSNRLVAGAMAGGYGSVFRGRGVEFDEVREYSEGDDPRTVDWNVTARVGRPFVKKYIDERELTALFLVDLSASMSGAFGAWSSRQMAARICACLALSAVRNHDKVGMIAFSDAVERYVPPKRGLGHALRIVRDCLALKSERPRASTRMVAALEFAASVLRRRSILFLVSDFQDPDLGRATPNGSHESFGDVLARVARRHDVVAVRLLPPELEPPSKGLWRLRDPESGASRLVDWSHAPTRAAYRENVRRWRARSEEALRRARVDRMDVPVPRAASRDAIARPILSFFRMRELRGAKR